MDNRSEVDYRDFYGKGKIRNTPFKLPDEIENKLNKIALSLKLKFCSFDLIYSEENKFIFIEANPEGQIGWVSSLCNYFLEAQIANYLNNYGKERSK